ncbi:MAG: hypothetical protein IT310_09220, partial [Anaerolineales bacterium]|nr:hypothetical protein [Anaerolineales bacterium]
LDSNILWGTGAMTLLGAALAGWEAQRRKRAEEKARMERRARKDRQKELEANLARKAAERARQANQNQHMEDKMNAIDAADEAEWNRVQSALDLRAVLAAQARQDGQNQYMDNKMSAIDAADDYPVDSTDGTPKPLGSLVKSLATVSGDGILLVVIVLAILSVVGLAWEARRRHRSSNECLPNSTLANCFNDQGIMSFENNESITTSEFEEFQISLYQDVDYYNRNPGDWGRVEYDTPFYDGNPNFMMPWTEKRPDKLVCIEGVSCSRQSAVNYIGQGAYSADSGETLEDALRRVENWNELVHAHSASDEELYWTTYGYNNYLVYKQKQCEELIEQGQITSLGECK